MKIEKGAAALIISEENRRYYTGLYTDNGYYLVTEEKRFFITDSRYIEDAENTVKNAQVILQTHPFMQILSILQQMKINRLYIEASRMTVAQLAVLRSYMQGIEICEDSYADELITADRDIKTQNEISLITKAQRIAEKSLAGIVGMIKPGVTERQIRNALDHAMFELGADALSFDTIAITGENTSKPHGVPSDTKVKSGDLVTLDFGAVCGGYHSDMTRTFAVGSVSESMKEVYDTVLKAQNAGIAAVKAGVTGADADRAARQVIADAGYGKCFSHSLGHGVGIEIHETPNLSPSYEKKLKAGNVVTVEPGIYIEKKFGVRIEDMVVVTENGCEDLTKYPKELTVL